MIVVSNKYALLFGLGSLAIALAVGNGFGWVSLEKGRPSPHENYVAFACGGLLALSDLVWRMQKVSTINVPDAPTIITRQGPVFKKPEPVTKLLNLLLGPDYGAQFFWVVPGWTAGLLLIWITRS